MDRPPSSSTHFTVPLHRKLTRTVARRIPETLSPEILKEMETLLTVAAPPKPNYPIMQPADMANYDGLLLGVPIRFGSMPAQWKVRCQVCSTALILNPRTDVLGPNGCTVG